MTFTENALKANYITQAESDALENWIDENCDKVSVIVPSHLTSLWGKVALFNFSSEVIQ